MFKSKTHVSEEQFEEMKSECLELYFDALVKINKLNTKLPLVAFSFNSKSNFLTITDKDDYKFYTEKLKNLSEAIQPILKHLDIR